MSRSAPIIALIALNIIPISASAQSSSDMREINDGVEHLSAIGNFAESCSRQAEFDPDVIDECMAVIEQFNAKMGDLLETHGEIIRKYTGGPMGFGP